MKMKSDIDFLEELMAESVSIISEEEYRRTEKNINEAMEKYDLEWKAYMAYSIESAKHSYITF
jgi:hypothetical protein